MTRRLLPSLVVAGLLVAACADGDGDGDTATTTTAAAATSATSSSVPTTSSTAPPTTQAASAASLDTRFDQIVGWLNGEPFDEDDFDEGFDPTFRAQITYEELSDLAGPLLASGPWRLVSEERSPDGVALVAQLTPSDGSDDLALTLVVGADDAAQIEGLLFAPAVDVEPAADAEEAADALVELGEVAVGVFEVTDGECAAPVLERGADVQAPIGSAFKLWVLGAVVDAVDTGTVAWEDEVTIEDRFDSLPSGTTQDEPAGTTLTVRTLAERMISISDNTATDLLIDLVGRDAVEAALVSTGHVEPDRNRPFFTTRELFIVKLDEDLRSAYLAADEQGRRDLLVGPVAEAELPELDSLAGVWTGPIEVEALEWFASPADLCRVLTVLADDEVAREVIALNPGAPDEAGRWRYVGFKGGSEPGVLNLSWLVEDRDGGRWVVAGSVWSTDDLLDDATVTVRLAELRDLIAAE
ncbi:MAG: serine hydrolase [Actinomycetota bacterium]